MKKKKLWRFADVTRTAWENTSSPALINRFLLFPSLSFLFLVGGFQLAYFMSWSKRYCQSRFIFIFFYFRFYVIFPVIFLGFLYRYKFYIYKALSSTVFFLLGCDAKRKFYRTHNIVCIKLCRVLRHPFAAFCFPLPALFASDLFPIAYPLDGDEIFFHLVPNVLNLSLFLSLWSGSFFFFFFFIRIFFPPEFHFFSRMKIKFFFWFFLKKYLKKMFVQFCISGNFCSILHSRQLFPV